MRKNLNFSLVILLGLILGLFLFVPTILSFRFIFIIIILVLPRVINYPFACPVFLFYFIAICMSEVSFEGALPMYVSRL